ncbi:rhox homeobox family member 2B-like [Onychomys torridus]|uniref:rhox homeobox family member 2B-like n=1 Tax=Onychomys torridus TaxID=38674 RepID=UPI00167F80E3|nr:rhox homeobox family member 2B-like [Onychomys torridus]
MKRQNVDYLLHVGPDEDEENWSGAKAPMVLPDGEGRNEEASGQGQPGREAAAAAEGEGAGELSGEGPSAADAAGLADDGNQEGASGGARENEQLPQELVHEGMGDNEGVPPVPMQWSCVHPVRMLVPGYRPRHHHRFTLVQLQELESIFQRTQYISAAEAARLATSMGVTEARLQRWFFKRREQYRRYKRL